VTTGARKGVRRVVLVGLSAAVVLGVAAAAFAIGHATAGVPPAASPDAAAGYSAGLLAGRSQGLREGRALQEGAALPAGARAPVRAAFEAGYVAGANDVFTGYDGGWAMSSPYLVVLAPGGAGVSYRILTRTPVVAGVDYHLCTNGSDICQQPR
jgi:hypothetical protein